MKDLDLLLSSSNISDLNLYTKIVNRCEDICTNIIDYDRTIRQVAENICISKSTVHIYIHTYIRCYMDDEYCQIVRKLRYNKMNRNKPRKYW